MGDAFDQVLVTQDCIMQPGLKKKNQVLVVNGLCLHAVNQVCRSTTGMYVAHEQAQLEPHP